MPTDTLLPGPGATVLLDRDEAKSDELPGFLAGDIVLFSAQRDLYSAAGRWIMQTSGEGSTYAVHTAQFLDAGSYLEMEMVTKVKPTRDILKKRHAQEMWRRRGFQVWRCRSLTPEQREAVTRKALTYVGAKFGMAKLLTHLLDGLINKATGREIFFFRRLNHDQRYPTCSWITSFSYDRALHYRFGVPPECADPDAINDWVKNHPDEWVQVFELEEYS